MSSKYSSVALAAIVFGGAVLFVAGCGDNGAGPPDAAPPTECSDGLDNDGDGTFDFPADLGCVSFDDDSEGSPTSPRCNDGRDNDGDGKLDYPQDPGCGVAQEDEEADDCPSGPNCPQCGNNSDDDKNGFADFPGDMGCESAADRSEFLNNPQACGPNLVIKQLPPNGKVTGVFDHAASKTAIATPCGGGNGAAAFAYAFLLTEPKVVVASTNFGGTSADTVVDIRRMQCTDATAELACSDDIDDDNFRSLAVASLAPGIYYVIVQGRNPTTLGGYELSVELFRGEGEACTMESDCGPGLVCRVPHGGSDKICTKPVCDDGLDDDGDAKSDFPDDPGCANPSDDTEEDTCPAGPGCPECGDGVDNDGDGDIDFPADDRCTSAAGVSETCGGETDAIVAITAPTVPGTLVGATDSHAPSCGGDDGADRLYTIDVPALAELVVDTNGTDVDTVLSLMTATCEEPGLACNDQSGVGDASRIAVKNLAAGRYVIAVDAFNGGVALGAYDLHVKGTIGPGGSCESPLFPAVVSCGVGFTCKGPVGAKTCSNECTDGLDNNGDGKFDFPNDPGCASPNDDDENTVCPGSKCPQCSDGADNDGDGSTDFPADTSCIAAAGTEFCEQSEQIDPLTQGTTTGTTIGFTHDIDLSCSFSGPSPDLAYQLDLPAMNSLTMQLDSTFSSSLALVDAACDSNELACQSFDNEVIIEDIAAGRYFVIVDGAFNGEDGDFSLIASGEIAPNGSCESALAQSGVFTCAAGTTCSGAFGARTCKFPACSDGVDNNGNGKIDFPVDPGCTSPLDDLEETVCPGPACPVCSNTADDDTDTRVDWPADFGCSSAAGASEVFCAVDPNFAGSITAPVTTGTLAAPAADNYEQACQAVTGNDLVYSLVSPVAATWEISTEGSLVDTIVSVTDANCGLVHACDDDSGVGEAALINRFLLRGNYAIQVDSFDTTNNGAFTLRVRGTVAAGTACTSPLFASGVLACAAGTTCTAGTCQ